MASGENADAAPLAMLLHRRDVIKTLSVAILAVGGRHIEVIERSVKACCHLRRLCRPRLPRCLCRLGDLVAIVISRVQLVAHVLSALCFTAIHLPCRTDVILAKGAVGLLCFGCCIGNVWRNGV